MMSDSNRYRVSIWSAACILACAVGTAPGRQGEAPPPGAPTAPTAAKLPPQVVLGRRVEAVRRNLKVSPTVVLVRNTSDYVRAIGGWSLAARYPVLLDDGTDRAREDIARFVRAFQPKSVIRWAAQDAPDLTGEPDQLRMAVESAARAAWGAKTPDDLKKVWQQAQFEPMGVVVASPVDPAWTAALALAAGRGQPFVWVESKPRGMGEVAAMSDVVSFDARISKRIDELGYEWRGLGDTIDSITLCLTPQLRYQGPDAPLAVTDRIGRHASGDRYAWTGVVPGDAAQAAYRAMCALFVEPGSAWLFDGYKPDFAPPYAIPAAANLLQDAGFKVSANTPPHGGLQHWRQRAAFGVPFDFIHVNSSGNNNWFELSPGIAFASEIPTLKRPALVHFIHSFSAQVPNDMTTIAGRWLENGVYAYYGSMEEPFLGAFLPAASFVGRMVSGASFAAAARQDGQPPWKLNVFGDPLIVIGGPLPKLDDALQIQGAVSLDAEMKSSLKEKKLAEGAAALVLLGKDELAWQIAAAALAAEPSAMTPDLARIAITPAFREGKKELFFMLYGAMKPEDQRDTLIADMLWQSARPDLESTRDDKMLGWLRSTVRRASIVEDATDLAPALKRVFGESAARSLFGMLLERVANDERTRQRLQEAGAKY